MVVLGLVLILIAIVLAFLDGLVPTRVDWLLNAAVIALAIGVILLVHPTQLGFSK